MSLGRQGRDYLAIGLLQWLVDWGVVVALTHAGLGVTPANIIGRVSGALLGYWLNGKLTFAGENSRLGAAQFRRFLVMWVATTAVSTFAVAHVDAVFGLRWVWMAKPAIEIALGGLGFLLSRHWVYRR